MALKVTEPDLARLMRSLGPHLLAVARGICRDADVAEDVVQEAFVKLWRTPPDGPEKVVPSWMRRVVTNLSINHLRRSKRAESLPDFSTDRALQHRHLPEDRIDIVDNLRRVDRALRRISDDKGAILVMRVYQGMSYQDIASALNVPVGTVMSRLNRARAALRAEIEAQLIDAEADPLVFPLRNTAGGSG